MRPSAREVPSPFHLQHQFSRPIHLAALSYYRDNLVESEEALAQHLSECGVLGTPWLELLPNTEHRIRASAYLIALALFLRLPLAGFAGMLCKCGKLLSAVNGMLHASSCNCHESDTRHDTFGKRYANAILCCLPPKDRLKIISGVPHNKHGLSLGFRSHTDRTGKVTWHEVKADTTFRGLTGKSPAWEGHVDYNVCDPTVKTYVQRGSARQELKAAKISYRAKELLYSSPGLLTPNQEVYLVVAELYGGLHETSWKQLQVWAEEFAPQREGVGRKRVVQQLLAVWRSELSLGLLEARVGQVDAAVARLREWALTAAGVPVEEQRQQLRVYDVCESVGVLQSFAEQARANRGFWRVVDEMW